ncbi:MAG: MAPEG family protein [Candidatus Eremiobacteraeota bacterium]|nr:MAPEG family protein [Candidatus Eremiobacteraeota bacterium]
MNQDAVAVLAATATFLFLKMQTNSVLQGYARAKGVGFVYPEDQAFFGGPKGQERSHYEDLHFRATAAWRNDVENIPMFLMAAVCGLLAGVPLEAFRLLLIGYCVCRSLHTVFLVKSVQPWRFLLFATGNTITGVLFLWSLRLVGF